MMAQGGYQAFHKKQNFNGKEKNKNKGKEKDEWKEALYM